MTDTLVDDTFFIVLQSILAACNQVTQSNNKIGFQL